MHGYIADNLKYLRFQRTPAYSQREIARKMHISRSTYGRYERGELSPPIWFLERIAEFYGLDMQLLLWSDLRKRGITTNESIT